MRKAVEDKMTELDNDRNDLEEIIEDYRKKKKDKASETLIARLEEVRDGYVVEIAREFSESRKQ